MDSDFEPQEHTSSEEEQLPDTLIEEYSQDPLSKPTEAAIPISSEDPFESSFQH